jgi:hypothetical protein
MKEIKLIPNGKLSKEAIKKLYKQKKLKELKLLKLQKEYDEGKFDEFFNEPNSSN